MHKLTKDAVPVVVGSPTGRVYTDSLRAGAQRYYQDLRISGTINVTVAVTRVINRGSILGAWSYLGLNDGGVDVIKADARTLGLLTDVLMESARANTRLAGVGVAATPLVESIRLSYAWPVPDAAIPQETVYVQSPNRTADQKLRLFGELRAEGGQGGIVQGGTANMSVVPRFTAVDVYDDVTASPPSFVPYISQDLLNVVAASDAARHEFAVADYAALRGIIIQTDSDAGEVGDVIDALSLTVAGRRIIGGEALVPWDDLLRGMELEHGGAVYATGVAHGQSAYLFIGFTTGASGGRLSNALPANLPNARFTFNWQPSVQAGVTVTQVRITYLGLKRVPGLTRDNLKYVA